MIHHSIKKRLLSFLEEDIFTGDITTDSIFNNNHKSIANVILKDEAAVLCGINFFKELFLILDADIKFNQYFNDSDIIKKGNKIITVKGSTKNILKAERVSLNILQFLSGISTKTKFFCDIVKDTNIKILDTRKTLPGFRYFEKYAVKIGGGTNHRMGLYDAVLIKDNHIKGAGSLSKAVKLIKSNVSPLVKIEVETKTFNEVKEAVNCGIDIIMLDNMDFELLKKSADYIKLKDDKILIEVSGNMEEKKIIKIKKLKIDFISIGCLTHSVKSIDFSMNIE